MNDRVCLPRSAIGDALWRDKDFGRLLWFLISRTDSRGAATFTAAEVESRLGISRQRLRTMLGKIRKTGLATSIQPTTNQQATNITFDCQSVTPPEQPTTNQQATNKQPTKARRSASKFIPPTDAEVRAYCREKGYHFDPEEFVPFYQTRGWKMKGGVPMKDWKAGCRYWETNWKKKYGERFYYETQQPARVSAPLRSQADRYSALERAANTVIFNAPDYNSAQND